MIIRNKAYPNPFSSFFETFPSGRLYGRRQPTTVERQFPVDVLTNDQLVRLRLALPGVSRDRLQVQVEGNLLVVSVAGSVEHTAEPTEGSEAQWTQLLRIAIPPKVNGDAIQATLRDGILQIDLERKAEATNRTIEIK